MKIRNLTCSVVASASGKTAPTEFRIWRAGANDLDGETIYFTQRSADLLMAEQAKRDRLYSFDFDHLSVRTDRPAEAGRAAGWHKLEVRNGELWAAKADWCADVKAGLEESPPRWRYFSPAFRVNEKGEVVGYTNCAVTNNPRTHGIQSLAAITQTKETEMDISKMIEILKALSVPDEQKEAVAAVVAELEKLSAGTTDEAADDGDAKEDKAAAEGDEGDEKKSKSESKVEAALSMALGKISELTKIVQKQASIQDAQERKSVFASFPAATPEMVKALEGVPTAKVKQILASAKLEVAPLNSRATQPEGRDVTASANSAVDRAMGISVMASSDADWIDVGGRMVLNTDKIKRKAAQ